MDAKLSYREAAVRGASPVGLVICLYQQAIEDLRQAVLALENRKIETRTHKINHAITILGQLQGSLDLDRGGEVAANLSRFYDMVRDGLMEAQFKQSTAILQQQLSHLVMVYEAWLVVERAAAPPSPEILSQPAVPSPDQPGADWSA